MIVVANYERFKTYSDLVDVFLELVDQLVKRGLPELFIKNTLRLLIKRAEDQDTVEALNFALEDYTAQVA